MVKCNYDLETLKLASREFLTSGQVQLLSFLSELPKLDVKFVKKYVPEKYSYSVSKSPAFFNELQSVISILVGKKVTLSNALIYKFDKGDYTVLFDELKPNNGIALFLDFNELDESCGGYTSFIGEKGEIVRIVPKSNALTLVNQDKLKSFTKYVNHHARQPRVFLHAVVSK